MGTTRSHKKQPTPSLRDELAGLAGDLAGMGWKTKPEIEWTSDERTAYERWAKREWAALRERQERGEYVEHCILFHEEAEAEKRTRVGAFLRPFSIEIDRPGAEPFRP